ncbi:hypothetical protein FQA39_LY11315 [Lamprigera yunnana]|nr:hypothetical protein FQA39_LY11315 [Lamprigera yunnana]
MRCKKSGCPKDRIVKDEREHDAPWLLASLYKYRLHPRHLQSQVTIRSKMNSLAVIFMCLGCALAQYRPQPNYQPNPVGKVIQIVKQLYDLNPDGSYQWSYDTENGISASEQGVHKQIGNEGGSAVQGQFSYPSLNGETVQIQYIADENGFQPQGNVLPTPPPIPEAILRSLAYNAAHPEQNEPQYNKPQKRY